MNIAPNNRGAGTTATLIATCFGVGYAKWAPGTVGSLVTLPFAWMLVQWTSPIVIALVALIIFALGVWAGGVYNARTGRGDAPEIVIDEVAGQLAALIFARPDTWWHIAVGFALFRTFDIFKPWPVSWADRNLSGGLGVMLDDLLAGIYASILLYALIRFTEAGYFT